jgi:integrase
MSRKGRRGDGWVYYRADCSKWWIGYHHRGRDFREPGGATEPEATRRLKARLKEIAGDRFVGPREERVLVDSLLDSLELHLVNRGARSVRKVKSHLKAVRAFFGTMRAIDLSTHDCEVYTAQQLAAGKARATVNRELELLRQSFRLAARTTPPRVTRVPFVPMLKVENARQGFLSRADFEALLAALADPDVRDFVEWGWWTGMRKGEVAKLTWEMFDRETWTMNLDPRAAKTGRGRVLALEGPLRTIVERRLKARRLDCALVFHRTSKGEPGQPVRAFDRQWRAALDEAKLPPGLLFHDLRRSAIRNMVRGGVDPTIAMRISGHTTASTFRRYNIVSTDDLRDAVKRTAAYVLTLPAERNVVELQAKKKA